MRIRTLLHIFVCLILPFQIHAQPTVSTHDVNGYPTYIVNTHVGNRIAVTFNVEAGSLFDDPAKGAGMAHLFEHVLFLGHDFENRVARLGGKWNAYTDKHRTFFYIVVHPMSLEGAIELEGAMISSGTFPESEFEKEQQVVMEEAGTYQKRDETALEGLSFLTLFPPADRWGMYDVGTHDQLKAMTVDHMRALWQANYGPKSAQIILAGNFDNPDLDVNDVLTRLRKHYFPPPQDPELAARYPHIQPAYQIQFSPIFQNGQTNRFLEIDTKIDQRTLSALFEIPGDLVKESALLETICDYVNLNSEGSILRELETLGWINSGGADVIRANNRGLVHLNLSLTQNGAKHRTDILSRFFAAIHQVATDGISEDTLTFLLDGNLNSYKNVLRKSFGIAELLASRKPDFTTPESALDIRSMFSGVTRDAFRDAMARIFEPGRMLPTYMGPDVRSSTAASIFTDRRVNIVDSSSSVRKWQSAYLNGLGLRPPLFIAKVPVSRATRVITSETMPPEELKTRKEGETVLLERDHRFGEAAVLLELLCAIQSSRTELAMDVFLTAFTRKYANELESLRSLGYFSSISYSESTLYLSAGQTPSEAMQALDYVLKLLLGFKPTVSEIRAAQEKALTASQEAFASSFPAFIAREPISALFRSRNRGSWNDDLRELKKPFTRNELLTRVQRTLRRADRKLAISGACRPDEAYGIADSTWRVLPLALTEKQRVKWQNPGVSWNKNVRLWTPLASNMGQVFGQSLALVGPSVTDSAGEINREFAALEIMAEAISTAVFQLNRNEKALGYVERALLDQIHRQSRLVFLGETDHEERFPEIRRGWDEIMDQIRRGTFSAQSIERAREGLLLTRGMLPETLEDSAHDLLISYYRTGRPDFNARLLQLIPTITNSEALATAQRIIAGAQTTSVEVVSSHSPCRGFLTEIKLARRVLSGKNGSAK